MSTQLSLVPGGMKEPLSQMVARRLRGQLAELRISGSALARITGLTQSKVSRRLTGDAPLELDELQRIEEATGISVAYLLGYTNDTSKGGPGQGPDGGIASPIGANLRAKDYKVTGSEDVGNVITLWPMPAPIRELAAA